MIIDVCATIIFVFAIGFFIDRAHALYMSIRYESQQVWLGAYRADRKLWEK